MPKLSPPSFDRRFVVECVGTFIIVFTICTQPVVKGSVGTLTIAAVWGSCVYNFHSISGAHFNPAVSLALCLCRLLGRGDFSFKTMLQYSSAQSLGGILGAMGSVCLSRYTPFGSRGFMLESDSTAHSGLLPLESTLVNETIFTIAFVLMALIASKDDRTEPTKSKAAYFGLVTGCVIAASSEASGVFEQCMMNPALSLGALVKTLLLQTQSMDPWAHHIFKVFSIYLCAEISGAALAACLFFELRQKSRAVKEIPFKSIFLAEFIGTFVLMYTVALCVQANLASTTSLLGIASAFVAMTYTLHAISGAHMNPAVSVGVFIVGSMKGSDLFLYISAQILGALFSLLPAWFVSRHWPLAYADVSVMSMPITKGTWLAVGTFEILYTFLLTFTVLRGAASEKSSAKRRPALAAGFLLLAARLHAGKLSRGMFNPAVAISMNIGGFFLRVLGTGERSISSVGIDVAAYIFFELCGALCAAAFCTFLRNSEDADGLLEVRGQGEELSTLTPRTGKEGERAFALADTI
eukprot:TRINITY_DN37219_c0_g1_i1.p1 TRINITY_DN37219_c0_g1~~TRINITY_DN37219_c0_g1_i1.p1  ORF type:complete len:530 (-),score=60.46 TRINITY_DN37219_c0_g1_i1:35-1603(-)